MTRFWSNVALSTLAVAVVVVPSAAMQARRFRNGTKAPSKSQRSSCESAPNPEFFLDGLSWELYEGATWDLKTGRNLSMKEISSSHDEGLSSQASARINRFVQAVATSHMNRSVGAVGSTNSSKGMSKAVINGTAGSAYCCHQLAYDDPYWQETENYHVTYPGYIKCEYSDSCTRKVTNSMRVKSIRRALKGAQQAFSNMNVQSLLYGGSAMGQYRCKDVIPWDVDCDIMISQADVAVIHRKVFKKELDYNQWVTGETSVDLAHFGAPGIRLVKKNPCSPFEIVDTQEGFFCDVFTSNWYSSQLFTPWWSGPYSCPQLFEGCDQGAAGQRCFRFEAHTMRPTASCMMAGISQHCPPDMPTYLQALYGDGWHTPNQSLGLSYD